MTEAASQLGVNRVTLSGLINGQAGISPDMARRLEAWLDGPQNGPSAASWLEQQMHTTTGRIAESGASGRSCHTKGSLKHHRLPRPLRR